MPASLRRGRSTWPRGVRREMSSWPWSTRCKVSLWLSTPIRWAWILCARSMASSARAVAASATTTAAHTVTRTVRPARRRLAFDVDARARSDRAGTHDDGVDADALVVETDRGLQHARLGGGRVRIQVDHHASFVVHRHGHGGSIRARSQPQDLPDPGVLGEGDTLLRFDQEVRPKATHVRGPSRGARP